MDNLLLITRILVIILSFFLFFYNLRGIFEKKKEWNWLKIMGGLSGLITGVFYILIVANWLEASRVMINPIIILLVSTLLSNSIYSKKTRGL